MIENLIIISAIGLSAGFLLSIPAGGPTSIVIFTNALKGKSRHANMVNLGACIPDFIYVFISIFGLTKFYILYQPYIPSIFLVGSLFVIFIGLKTFKTKHPLEEYDETTGLSIQVVEKTRSGFLTGMMLGFFNPGLIMSWMASTLIVLSTLSSYGFNTAGLEGQLNNQLKEINQNKTNSIDSTDHSLVPKSQQETVNPITNVNSPKQMPRSYPFWLSFLYALSTSIGTVIWFYYVILFLSKFRKRISPKIIHRTIQILGFILVFFGIILGYKGISMLFLT